MGTRQNQPRKSALASKLLPYLAAVEAAAAQRATRERRLPKRLYRTRNQGEGEGGAEPRQVTGAEMLYALRRYARGDGLRQIVEDFKERDIGGVSEVGIFRAGQRFERWWGEGREVGDLNELIGLLAEPDPYRDSLTRELVPALEGVAGSRSGLPVELRWQRWTLPEIWLFVRSGHLPPRVLYAARHGNDPGVDWVRLTALLTKGGAEASALAAWQKLQRTWQRRHPSAARAALAPRATRESVRKALLKGSHPHRWVVEPGFFKKASVGRWTPVVSEVPEPGVTAATPASGEDRPPASGG